MPLKVPASGEFACGTEAGAFRGSVSIRSRLIESA
jgi:hypothetical protein